MNRFRSKIRSIIIHSKEAYYANKDYHTNRKIVVFESDDWGSIRMSNKKAWNELLRLGYAVDQRPYERFDTLESVEDLEALFNVLSKYKDINGNHPVITANMLMANPDFEKIEKSRFQEYYFEPIAKTYDRYFGDNKLLDLMRQGMKDGMFMPQSHGREHFNVSKWMKGLQERNNDLLTAFKLGMCGIAPKDNPGLGNQMLVALKAERGFEKNEVKRRVAEGLRMFEELWGVKSKSFIAPCYTWDDSVEEVLFENGVNYLQGGRWQRLYDGVKQIPHYTGQKQNGLVYGVRNCFFEPAVKKQDGADSLMRQVDALFAKRKIVIISTHRINFVSGIDERNRTRNLSIFDAFLSTLIKKCPDVEFMSSNQLFEIFNK